MDRNKLNQVFDPSLVNQVCGITIPLVPQQDMFVWGPSPNGCFSVKSATWIQYDPDSKHMQANLINKVWKSNCKLAPKIKIFAWLLCRMD